MAASWACGGLSRAGVILSQREKSSVRRATSPRAAKPELWGAGVGKCQSQARLGGPDNPRWSLPPSLQPPQMGSYFLTCTTGRRGQK